MELKTLANQKTFTKEEREFLRAEAERLNVPFEYRRGCRDCYTDLAIQLFVLTDKTENRKYILKDGVDFYLGVNNNRIRVNAATLTDDLAKKLIAAGYQKYFVKYEV